MSKPHLHPSAELIELESRFLIQSYRRQPVVLERGEGCYVFDKEGRRYLDLMAGVAVDVLGHCHPEWVSAVCEQSGRLVHVSNLFYSEPMIHLAKRLAELSGLERSFLCNSGTEANEAAIKIARKWGLSQRGADCYTIITFERAFHGRTMGALAATGNKNYSEQFGPGLPGFVQLKPNDLTALQASIGPHVCAVMAEVVQGEGGVYPLDLEFLRELRRFCDEHQLLLIIDEVQTAIGRTGKWFAYQHANILPDLVPLAKGLGGGFPIGACLARGEAATMLVPGDHGSTYAGSPLACSAALTVLKVVERDNLLAKAGDIGNELRSGLEKLCSKFDWLDHVRGLGLMLALELKRPLARRAVTAGLSHGLLLNATSDTTLRFVPPLILSSAQVSETLGGLDKVFQSLADSV